VSIRNVLVVFNPVAGVGWKRREGEVETMVRELRAAGVAVATAETRGPQAPPGALFEGLGDFEAVLACGGDGTVNEILQGLVKRRRQAKLGIIPMGSGNLMAGEMGMHRPLAANVKTLLSAPVESCRVACIAPLNPSGGPPRYWLAAAGIGADARVICGINPAHKARFGIVAYYAESARQLLFTREPFSPFVVEFVDPRTGAIRSEVVTQVVVERIGYFGRFLEESAADPLASDAFRAVLFKTARRWDYLAYGVRLLAYQALGRYGQVSDVEVIRTDEISCRALPKLVSAPASAPHASTEVLAEVDGELLGGLPVRVGLANFWVGVLCPGNAQSRDGSATLP
jgi:diacylglycerol kinase family enzyme